MGKYLVTGGAGFIGSNIVDTLIQNGEDVRVIDDLSTGSKDNLSDASDNIEFIEGDIRDNHALEKALNGIEYVIHQAARRSVPKSIDNPMFTNDVNVNGTLNLLVEAKKAGVKRVVSASSSSVYGVSEIFPQHEGLSIVPISPYAVSKLAGEYYCRMFSATFGLETVSLRYFNVFGPRQNPESQYSAVIPAFIDSLINDKPCVVEGSGEQARDFTYVQNVVDANIAACTAKDASGEVINVACGESYSVNCLADSLKNILGKDIPNNNAPARIGDVPKTVADITKLKDLLGVDPEVDFYSGLEKTVKWFLGERK